MMLAACNPLSLGPTPQGTTASSARHPTPLPSGGGTTAEQGGAAVWVMSPVGVNIHTKADEQSDKIATATQGDKLFVKGSKRNGKQTWLQVQSESGATKGWVVDDPTLVIHREIKRYTDPAYTFLYPAGWTVQGGNPATFTAPTGDPNAGVLTVQYGDDVTKLPGVPLHPAKESGENEPKDPIEVYGVTAFVAVYQLTNNGGWEYLIEKKIGSRVFLFDFTQAGRQQPDISLFTQLLSSVTVSA